MAELMIREGFNLDDGGAEGLPEVVEAAVIEEVILDKPKVQGHVVEGLPPTNIPRLGHLMHNLGGFAAHHA